MTMEEHPRETLDPQEHDLLSELTLLARLGVLSLEEQQRVALHLRSGCARCSLELRNGSDALDVLALATPGSAPSAGARDALLAAVESQPLRTTPVPLSLEAPRRPRPRGSPWAIAASLLALALSSGALFAVLRQQRDSSSALQLASAQLDARLSAEAQRLEALAQRVGSFEQALQAQPASSVTMALAGEASFGSAEARVVMDAAGQQVLLLASRLPPLPPGRTYQLWVIVSGAPESLGVFEPDHEGRVVFVESKQLELSSGAQVAVSVEPAGGVPQPTGPIVLVSR
jgi:hypothetical protein